MAESLSRGVGRGGKNLFTFGDQEAEVGYISMPDYSDPVPSREAPLSKTPQLLTQNRISSWEPNT